MQFTYCLLKCTGAHSWKTTLGEFCLFPSFCSFAADSDTGLEEVSCLALELPASWLCSLSPAHNWLLLTRWYNSDQPWMVRGKCLLCWWVPVLSSNYKEFILILPNFRLLQYRSTHPGGTLLLTWWKKRHFQGKRHTLFQMQTSEWEQLCLWSASPGHTHIVGVYSW